MKLNTRQVEKPWGRIGLPPPFPASRDRRIGEIWFEPEPPCQDLLVKYIFTSEKLSVQVHPPGGPGIGKDECWLVLHAEPGAMLAIGFAEPVVPETIRAAALDGTIEGLLAWHPVGAGDFFYIPAGTVHAIGGGISLVEVQQHSDTTYRLYDYGRPRELHLDDALRVAKGVPHDPALRSKITPAGNVQLADGPSFRLDRVHGVPRACLVSRYADGPSVILPLEGPVTNGDEQLGPGECAIVRSLDELQAGQGSRYLLAQSCHMPGQLRR